MPMSPSRPYLLRALNDWILENSCTPYIVVDAGGDRVEVPLEYVKNGQIVLNINPAAVRYLELSNEAVSFEARFGGQSRSIFVPIDSVMAVYAKENGQGMVFGWETDPVDPTDPDSPPKPPGPGKKKKSASIDKIKQPVKPQLKVVK